jgi:hypothetical protein
VGITTDGELMRGGISLGRMRLVRFDRPQVLTQEAGALMVPNGAVATAATNTPINVGAIEESNATTVSAMTVATAAWCTGPPWRLNDRCMQGLLVTEWGRRRPEALIIVVTSIALISVLVVAIFSDSSVVTEEIEGVPMIEL